MVVVYCVPPPALPCTFKFHQATQEGQAHTPLNPVKKQASVRVCVLTRNGRQCVRPLVRPCVSFCFASLCNLRCPSGKRKQTPAPVLQRPGSTQTPAPSASSSHAYEWLCWVELRYAHLWTHEARGTHARLIQQPDNRFFQKRRSVRLDAQECTAVSAHMQ